MDKEKNEVMEGYKETEIGMLPADWKVVRLGDLFEIQQGKSLSAKYQNGKSPYPFLRTANVLWGYIDLSILDEMDFTDEEVQRLTLLPGDLLVCEGGEIGRTAIWQGQIKKCCYQNHLHRLRMKKTEVIPEFYMYWMQAAILLFGLYIGEGNKTTIPNLSKTRLSNFRVPHPPLHEQRKIAYVLSTIQRAIELQDKVIAALRELKKSLMRHLFTYGPVPVDQIDRVPLKETEIGMVPEHWEVVRLGEVVNIFDKRRIPLSENERQNRKGFYPYCGANGIIDYIDGYLFDGEYILLAEDGGYWGAHENSAYIMRGKFWANNHVHIIEAKDEIVTNQFLMFVLNYMDISAFISGTTRGKLTQGIMKTLPVPFPPLPEQNKIAHILTTVDNKIEAEDKRKSTLQSLFQTMLHLLMTGKVRVKDLEVNEDALGR